MKTSTPTDTADALHTAPDPLGSADLDSVPGVLGTIARERYRDYAAFVGDLRPFPKTPPVSFSAALKTPGLSLIAEVKQASPSLGSIATLDPVAAAEAYRQGGALALSVLTEPRHFAGSLQHLEAVAQQVPLPVLRKDFTVHPGQLIEARHAGASAALLIAGILGERVREYLEFARVLEVAALVEVHDAAELDSALAAGAEIIGVNNRNLDTLEIDLATAPTLLVRARQRGFQGLLVAESGYRDATQLEAVRNLADAVLVGSSLAGSGDLRAAVHRLLGSSSS